MNKFALTTAELEHLAARGLVGWQNPTLPGMAAPPPNRKRSYKRITPAQAMARRRAELRGQDTSRWPARVRPRVLASNARKAAMAQERRRIAVRDSLRRMNGQEEGVDLFLRGETLS